MASIHIYIPGSIPFLHIFFFGVEVATFDDFCVMIGKRSVGMLLFGASDGYFCLFGFWHGFWFKEFYIFFFFFLTNIFSWSYRIIHLIFIHISIIYTHTHTKKGNWQSTVMFRYMEKLFWRISGQRVFLILELDGRVEGRKRRREFFFWRRRRDVKWAKKKKREKNT